ncbi:programmed cell death protein 2-like [Atheta coriaria]|uniref:programmed cell death protein 2-like n=1 Tax=Dalotia coriaria TaxID=877792 RepID=UPI0031F43BA7
MACRKLVTLLGYEDEPVNEKNKSLANFTTNKVGGRPDVSTENSHFEAPNCSLCQLPRLLIVQIYAPIENSTYHRTLYVFACVNPNCWNQNDSWICLRAQHLDPSASTATTTSAVEAKVLKTTDWCADADDWDDDNSNFEENGNVVNKSDDDDESASLDDSIRMGLEQMGVDDNDKNANACLAEAQGGAVGTIQSPTPSAEIEGAEGEAVCIDTPTYPQRDISAILNETHVLPQEIFRGQAPPQFDAFFMSVYEEQEPQHFVDRHVRELLQEYQANNDDINFASEGGGGVKMPADSGGAGELTLEKYEKTHPAHGDKMFHYYLTKIRENPGHFLRYSRGANGLLLYPLQESMKRCKYCQGDMIFEFQLLPTLIPLLKLSGDQSDATRIEFGNVLVFTCSKSCWFGDALRQEYVVVQSENI